MRYGARGNLRRHCAATCERCTLHQLARNTGDDTNSTLRIVSMLLLLRVGAQAQDVVLGSGLFCDTSTQAQRFVALFDSDAARAVSAVNAE
jgi:hypothetical protein